MKKIILVLFMIFGLSSVFAANWKEIEDKDYYKVEQSEECYLTIKEYDDGLFDMCMFYPQLNKGVVWDKAEKDRIMFIYDIIKSLDDVSFENIKRMANEYNGD